jgi:hypothetical protein
MKKLFIIVLSGILVLSGTDAFGLISTARSTTAGIYEDGEYTPTKDGFEAEYVIDEDKETITLQKIISNNREGRIEDGIVYDITNTVVSEGISALLVSRNKKGQKIYTAVREGSLGASEILVIGKDFYQFCRAENGKFYLEYGDVR